MRRILIVDDEPLIREILMTTLADEGYEVVEAESGEVALELFREKPCDLVISDISMSNISGIDLLFSLKQIYPDVEVILITGYASVETAQAALEGGAYRYLKKPFHDLGNHSNCNISYRSTKQKRTTKRKISRSHMSKRYIETTIRSSRNNVSY